jgi:hypothetical protein
VENSKNQAIKYSEIAKSILLLDAKKSINVILSDSQAKLLERYLRRIWAVDTRGILYDSINLFMLQLQILFRCPQLAALGNIYDPDKIDQVCFEKQGNGLVLVTFPPRA